MNGGRDIGQQLREAAVAQTARPAPTGQTRRARGRPAAFWVSLEASGGPAAGGRPSASPPRLCCREGRAVEGHLHRLHEREVRSGVQAEDGEVRPHV